MDGPILTGGAFSSLAGQSRSNLARLVNTRPATNNLTFDGSGVSWLRGGSGPEFWRTSFEISSNGTNWLSLGPGTSMTGGWQLAGVSLPAYATLRARGFVTGGAQNSTSWLQRAYRLRAP